ncbi:serine O-acetyltransferase EpsC [Candidatus Omnitrophota bacterium]
MICLLQVLLTLAIIAVLFYILVRIFFKYELDAAMERDPAATNYAEIIFTYSGLHALVFYKVSRGLKGMGIPILPRYISQLTKWVTGIEIHPGATIGKGLFIDHGMGVVIGETSVIGNNVTLFQGVTLGGTGKEKGKRHPNIGDNVVVGAGAKILGNITVGNDTLVGANAVVIRDVPPESTVVGIPGRVAKKKGRRLPAGINLDHTSLPDPIQQALERLQHEIDHIESELQDHHEGEKPESSR